MSAPIFDDEFGMCIDPCEHPSINGTTCAGCGVEVRLDAEAQMDAQHAESLARVESMAAGRDRWSDPVVAEDQDELAQKRRERRGDVEQAGVDAAERDEERRLARALRPGEHAF